MSIDAVLDELAARIDLMRVDAAGWDIHDGTGPRRPVFERPAKVRRDEIRGENTFRLIRGMPRWAGLVLEAAVEAYAAQDRTELRRAVLETAVLAVAWVDDIDSRDDDDVQGAAA